MKHDNPRLMDAQLQSYLKSFAEGKSDEERTALSMAFYAGAISLQRVQNHVFSTQGGPATAQAQMIIMAVAEELQDTSTRIKEGRIVPNDNVKPG